jgi:hypothetical protein
MYKTHIVMDALKNIGAILLALIIVFVLSGVTDYVLETTGLMKLPFADNSLWLMLIVVLYRTIYVVIGGYVVAWFAPQRPMRLVTIYAAIGFVLGTSGAIMMWHEPPHWYPIVLIVLGVPAAWFGGKLKAGSNLRTSA